ncbi:unnamed protein product [Calypogeia fissa]
MPTPRQDVGGVSMDQIRRGWSREELHDGFGITAWWSCNLKGWDGFRVAVTADGEEALFRRCVDDNELEMVDMLQHATHVDLKCGASVDGWQMLPPIMWTSQNPAPFLEYLSISRVRGPVQIGHVILDIVSKLPRLTTLHLYGFGLSDGVFATIEEAAVSGYLLALRSLYLFNCHPGTSSGGHRTLAKAMESGHMFALEELHLRDTQMTEDGCKAYAAAISAGKLPSLTKIRFPFNRITHSGAQALARAILRLRELEILDLVDNRIEDEGLKALALSFQVGGADGGFPKLRYLNFYRNSLTEAGLLSLAKAISSGSLHSLETLFLVKSSRSYSISQECARALVSALANLTNLIEVTCPLHQFPALERIKNQNIESNKRMRSILRSLEDSPVVPATHSKVYICGDPEVGKTTLRKTLQRSFWKSFFSWEKKTRMEQRTRGIDVSIVASKVNNEGEKPNYLLVWDMAGQREYHLLHNSFLPDLRSAKGNATSFIVVCSSKTSLTESKQQLIYWLRFIASSCGNTTENPRHVLVVVNNIGGDSKAMAMKPNWEQFIVHQRQVFKNFLDINTDPFIVDVRLYQSVQHVKSNLLNHARRSLQDETVPEICQFIERNLPAWSKVKEQFPVLEWTDFVHEICEQSGEPWAEEKLDPATRYLNEAGVLVYINVPLDIGSPSRRLVVLDPNWFCKDIAGKMFLHQDMVRPMEPLFRRRVDNFGSISISEFKEFFRYSSGEWTDLDFTDLIAILLWSGLCYQGRDQRLYIPALIADSGKPVWKLDHREDQWVMGFIIEHQKSAMALAPIALWHRFQVELGQASRFNGSQDNAFHNGRYFITFSVDYMSVLIEVRVDQGSPTFDDISIFVKPLWKKDDLDGRERKQRQVDLAKELVEVLLAKVWDKVCPGVEYVERVVWPWPACQPRPKVPERNLEVVEVKKLVAEHGVEKKMQILIGCESITGDQLLCTKEKEDRGIGREARRDGGEARILFPEVSYGGSTLALDEIEKSSDPMVLRKLDSMKTTQDLMRDLVETNLKVSKENKELLTEHRELLHKLQNSVDFFGQDSKKKCPMYIYVEERNSSLWMKQALPWKRYCLRFACEAQFKDNSCHEVKGQQGLDMPKLKDWARSIGAPWLKVSLTILLLSANVAANVVLPGIGLIIPSFVQYQQWSAIAGGAAMTTTLSRDQLSQIIERMGVDVSSVDGNPQELYGKSMEAISKLVGELTPEAYEEKVGLRKVCLYHDQHSFQNIVWICDECFEKYRNDPHTPMREL